MTAPVLFYGVRGEYGEFSNWYPARFELDGRLWRTSEHYLMAQKTTNHAEQEAIRRAKTPAEAKAMGRAVKLRRDWDDVKLDVMIRAGYAKFSQSELLGLVLMETGDAPIHEDCADPWWGGGPHFPEGRDLLGRALMTVRGRLLAERRAIWGR